MKNLKISPKIYQVNRYKHLQLRIRTYLSETNNDETFSETIKDVTLTETNKDGSTTFLQDV